MIQDDVGSTPLRAACKAGHVATVALLIKRGADVNNRIKVANIDIVHKDMHYSYHFYSMVYMHYTAPALRGN